jgi:hypothetical protein
MLIGVVLAGVLLAALFAAAYFGKRPRQEINEGVKNQSPSQIAAIIKPDFVGSRQLGHWTLSCGPGHELPTPPRQNGQISGNSQGAPPRSEPPPPHFKIPRCRVIQGMKIPRSQNKEVRVTFRQVGFKRALAVFVRIPPDEAGGGDMTTLRFDRTDRPMPVVGCGVAYCLAISSIRLTEESALLNSRQVVLIFTPRTAGKQIALLFAMDGLPQAIAVMRRIDK